MDDIKSYYTVTGLLVNMLGLDEAAAVLKKGGTIIYPTETFFGIGCLCGKTSALQAIYAAKRRPPDMPLPILAARLEDLASLAAFSAPALRLAGLFWPGPLSILLPALGHVPPALSGGTGRLALRLSSHPAARALALAAGGAIFASSANISGRPPVTEARALDPQLAACADGVFDAPPRPCGGLPSTLVEALGDGGLRIARPGAVSAATLAAAGFEIIS